MTVPSRVPGRGSRVSQPCGFDFTSSPHRPSHASSFVFSIAYRVHGKQNPRHPREKNVEYAARGRTRILGSFANSSYLRPPIFHRRGNCSIWLTIALVLLERDRLIPQCRLAPRASHSLLGHCLSQTPPILGVSERSSSAELPKPEVSTPPKRRAKTCHQRATPGHNIHPHRQIGLFHGDVYRRGQALRPSKEATAKEDYLAKPSRTDLRVWEVTNAPL